MEMIITVFVTFSTAFVKLEREKKEKRECACEREKKTEL